MSHAALIRDLARTSDAAFALYVSGLEFPRHLTAASRFAERHPKSLILMPRGHAKTTLFIHRAARQIGLSQGKRRLAVLTSVESEALGRSGAIRKIVESDAFAEVFPWARGGVRGSPWTDAAWTVKGAGLRQDRTCIARGLRGMRAGLRFDDILADDIVGKHENESADQRAKALDTYLSVVDPMVVPGGRRIFLGTRWHEDDIYATFVRQGWPVLLRKALQDDGSALWPEVYPTTRLLYKRTGLAPDDSTELGDAILGSAIFDLQYQNDPSGMGGNIFKREWFRYVTALPAGSRRVGMDLAAGTKERSDYTAAVEWWEDAELNLYLVGSFRERLDEGHRVWLTGMTEEHLNEPSIRVSYDHIAAKGPRLLWPTNALPEGFVGLAGVNEAPRPLTRLNIEATQYQSTFSREVLAKTRLPGMPVYPDTDKVTRARTLAARYEAGKVFHLRSAPGLDDFEQELVAFPNSEHDDQVDAAVHGADLNTASEFYFTARRR
jgi:phage terminase large subunit-like protein